MTKLVADFKYGTLSAGIGSTDTTITSAEFADLPVVSSPDTMDLVLNPGEVGGDAEIVTVTAHTSASTSVTVAARTGSAHGSGTQWVHAVTAADFNRMGFDGTLEGNADTATALETARTIGGVSFDGTANINLPGVNTAGNQDTSGNAATATALQTARTIDITGDITATAVAFDGTSNIAISAAVNNDSHTHDTQYVKLTGSTMTGELQLNARLDVGNGTGGDHEIRIYKADNNVSDHIQFYNGTTRIGEIGCEDTTWLRINQETAKNIYTPRMIRADGGYQAKDGTNAAPAYTFFNDTNTGMYRYGTDGIGFSNAGGLKVLIDNGGSYGRLFGPGFRTGSAIIRGEASAAIPTYTFYGDETTGMYRYTTNQIGFATGGAYRARIASDGIHLASGDWFRSYGSAGWYSQTYGGGWHMSDTSWLRAYGGKGIYTSGAMGAGLSSITSTSGYNYILRNATYSTFAYYTSSRDVKENIVDVTAADSGAWIDALQPVQFNGRYLGEGEEPEDERTWREADTQVGFIAEDVLNDPVTSQFSQVTDNGDGTLSAVGWKWECVIAAAVAEIKSLRARVAALELG